MAGAVSSHAQGQPMSDPACRQASAQHTVNINHPVPGGTPASRARQRSTQSPCNNTAKQERPQSDQRACWTTKKTRVNMPCPCRGSQVSLSWRLVPYVGQTKRGIPLTSCPPPSPSTSLRTHSHTHTLSSLAEVLVQTTLTDNYQPHHGYDTWCGYASDRGVATFFHLIRRVAIIF